MFSVILVQIKKRQDGKKVETIVLGQGFTIVLFRVAYATQLKAVI